ncbi:T9SS type A sorting domain-containing protein [Polaribacter sp.]|uniref:T9SS type A sorting domain-containing protein n=1 Tax=Polaribacter sp. TaxID=1920175 RepID=UPI003F6B3745
MFRYLLTFFLFTSFSITAQTETFSEKNVGSTGDFTNQPVSLQSEFSHSQTIYYQKDLEFKGKINEIRFRAAFSETKRENIGNWIVRIGITDKEEFAVGEPFVNVETLTEVFNGGYDRDGFDVIVRFQTPFYYDGTQHIILDVQDTDASFTTRATAGFKGEENFNNPPTRSKMTFTHQGKTTGVYENSFANTRFIGNLERCPTHFSIDKDVIGATTASFSIDNPNNINGFNYKTGLLNEPEPSDFQITNTNNFTFNNLIPGKDYILYYKSNCEIAPTAYKKIYFHTQPLALSIPVLIDFETESNNYYIENNSAGFIKVSEDAGLNASKKGLLLNGSTDFSVYNWWDDTNNLWSDNAEFISTLNLIIDLTENSIQPVFKFNLQQTVYASKLHLKIDGQVQDFEYSNTDVEFNTTRTISIDLSDFIGKKVTLQIEHLGKSHLHKSYIDDISLIEASCTTPKNMNFSTTENSIALHWESDAKLWEIALTKYDESFDNTGETIHTASHKFDGLEKAKPYIIFLRCKCDNSYSPWIKLYKSTKSEVLQVPYEKNFRTSDALNNTEFVINHSKYSKIYQDFNKLLFLDQKSNNYGWVGKFETTENEAWNANKNFISSISFYVDATNLKDLTAEINFKQHYYFSPNTSWFRIKVNGVQIENSYNPNSVRFDPYTELTLDLTQYVGNIIEITLEQVGLHGPTHKNSTANAGDFTILRSIHFTSATLSVLEPPLTKSMVYPNPVTKKLFVKTEQEVDEVLIYDINGKLLRTHKINKYPIDVSNIKKGIYFLKIKFKNHTFLHQKIMKR